MKITNSEQTKQQKQTEQQKQTNKQNKTQTQTQTNKQKTTNFGLYHVGLVYFKEGCDHFNMCIFHFQLINLDHVDP